MTEKKMPHKRPNGYWRDGENIERELKSMMAELGRFPTRLDFKRTGKAALVSAISRTGGTSAWRLRLGCPNVRKSKGYWDDPVNTERDLKAWIAQYNEKPTEDRLIETGFGALALAISRRGGLPAWRRRVGFDLDPETDWSDSDIERVVAAWIAEHGEFPNRQRRGGTALLAVMEKHRGISYWRGQFGRDKQTKPSGYWDDPVNVEFGLNEWIVQHGRFPTQKTLKAAGNTSLADGIQKNGGFRFWQIRLGREPQKRANGYWDDPANVERELKTWVSEHGKFPKQRDLAKTGSQALARGLSKHGGLSSWRARFGFVALHKPRGYWDDEINIERELEAWITEKGKFPTVLDLRLSQRGDLATAITNHGGFLTWKSRFEYEVMTRPKGYWDDEMNIERELRAWIAKHGKFPSHDVLSDAKQTSLGMAISKHGGYPHWRAKLGYGPITPECLREHADVLARVVLAMDLSDTGPFWVALQKRWTMHELTVAIREFEQEGKLERFKELLAAAD